MSRQKERVASRRWGEATSRAVRLLAMETTPITQVALAKQLGISQPRVSQIGNLLEAGGVRMSDLSQPDQRALMIDLYVRSHIPHVRTETLWYGLDANRLQVEKVAAHLASAGVTLVVSADVAPDFLAPWRSPTLTIIYVDESRDLGSVGLVPALGRGEATVIMREVADLSLLEAWEARNEAPFPLAHPVQQIRDLYDLGGTDRIEAAERLMRRILISGDPSRP